MQYLKFRWSYRNQTWTVSSSKGCSHLTDIPCPWVGRGQNVGLRDFCHILTLLPPGHPCFTNTCPAFFYNESVISFCTIMTIVQRGTSFWELTVYAQEQITRSLLCISTTGSNDLERSDTKLEAPSFSIEYKIFSSTFYAKPYINPFRNDLSSI